MKAFSMKPKASKGAVAAPAPSLEDVSSPPTDGDAPTPPPPPPISVPEPSRPRFPVGSCVHVKRSNGEENLAYVMKHDATNDSYTVELGKQGSGKLKRCHEKDLREAAPSISSPQEEALVKMMSESPRSPSPEPIDMSLTPIKEDEDAPPPPEIPEAVTATFTKTATAQLKENVRELTGELAEKKATIAQLQATIKELQESVKEGEGWRHAAEALTAAQAEMADEKPSDKARAAMRAEIEQEVRAQLSSEAKSKPSSKGGGIWQERALDAARLADELRDKWSSAESELSNVRKDLSDTRTKLGMAEAQMNESFDVSAEKQRALDESETALAKANDEIERAQAQVRELTAELMAEREEKASALAASEGAAAAVHELRASQASSLQQAWELAEALETALNEAAAIKEIAGVKFKGHKMPLGPVLDTPRALAGQLRLRLGQPGVESPASIISSAGTAKLPPSQTGKDCAVSSAQHGVSELLAELRRKRAVTEKESTAAVERDDFEHADRLQLILDDLNIQIAELDGAGPGAALAPAPAGAPASASISASISAHAEAAVMRQRMSDARHALATALEGLTGGDDSSAAVDETALPPHLREADASRLESELISLMASLKHADRELRAALSQGKGGAEALAPRRLRDNSAEEMQAQLIDYKMRAAQLQLERDESFMACRQLQLRNRQLSSQISAGGAPTAAEPNASPKKIKKSKSTLA